MAANGRGCGYLALLILLMGATGLWYSLQDIRTSYEISTWPSTEGEITSSGSTPASGRSAERRHHLEIRYKYKVKEKELQGQGLFPSKMERAYKKRKVEQVVKSYPVGKRVRVYYDPEEPENSSLNKSATSTTWLGLVFGAIISAVGFWALLVVVKASRAGSPD